MPDSYIIDVDIFLENAKKILNEAKKYGIKLYYMTKQIGRNPYLGKKLQEMGYSGVVAVDFREAEIFINNNLKIGNVGHLVQIPKNMLRKVIKTNPEIITVYSYEKAEEISEIALIGAEEGVEATKCMIPKFGKAAVFSAKANGIADQGAVAGYYLLVGIHNYFAHKEQ